MKIELKLEAYETVIDLKENSRADIAAAVLDYYEAADPKYGKYLRSLNFIPLHTLRKNYAKLLKGGSTGSSEEVIEKAYEEGMKPAIEEQEN